MTNDSRAIGRRTLLGASLSLLADACSSPALPPRSHQEVAARQDPHSDRRELQLPPRPTDAPSGSAFVDGCARLSAGEREIAIGREILAGNVPSFLRKLVRVPLKTEGQGPKSAAIWVTCDYLAIGSDSDFVRIPMAKRMAHHIARELDCVLPTSRLVDAIYAASTCKLTSPGHGASAEMASTQLYAIHSSEIEERRAALHCSLGALVAGPKKDLVMSSREAEKPGHLAIYGWFLDDGSIIQPLSLLHSERYVDFSHGVRLVAREMEIDGMVRAVVDVIRDRIVSHLVSDEGSWNPVEP